MTDHYYTSETENVGQFRCETTFIPSNVTFSTDLPASFEGRAEFPSPGVLLGSTLASCMMSLVSVVAARKGVDLKGMRVLARAAESSKGIEKIELKVIMPLEGSHPLRAMLEKPPCPALCARRCGPIWKRPLNGNGSKQPSGTSTQA